MREEESKDPDTAIIEIEPHDLVRVKHELMEAAEEEEEEEEAAPTARRSRVHVATMTLTDAGDFVETVRTTVRLRSPPVNQWRASRFGLLLLAACMCVILIVNVS